MKCQNCNQKLKKGMNQCPRCGTWISAEQNPSSASSKQKKLLITLICISGTVALALIVFAVFLIQNTIRYNNYINRLTLYRSFLISVQNEMDTYADTAGLGENDRKLVAIVDVYEEDSPSLFYVTDGQDEEENHFPVIRMCDIKNDETQVIYESRPDGPADYICILQDTDTGSLYLFSDYESPEKGNVAIYSLRREGDEILQKEKYRLNYRWQAENNDSSFVFEYFIDTQSVDENSFHTELDAFIPTIDKVIVSGGAKCRPLKYNYFDDIATVAMSYNDAVEYLDNGISGETSDEATPDESSPDEASKTESGIIDVDPSDIPESLSTFLQTYDFAHSGEFDCEDKDADNSNLVPHIAGNPSCVDASLYPGGEVKEIWQSGSDPLQKFINAGTLEFPKKKLLWILQNVFNFSAIDAQELVQKDLDSDPDFYEYDKDGEAYLYRKILGMGGPGYAVSYQTIRYDGEKYYIVYDCISGYYDIRYNSFSKTLYAELSEKEYNGQKYWSLYKHSENIPALPEADASDDIDVFSAFEGEYMFTSGIGAWGTFMTLHSDGSFDGEYHDSNMGESGNGYDSTMYSSKFSGHFKNPKKINAYTYSFELSDIQYENTPGTEEIKNFENSERKVRTIYSEAYGLHDADIIYIYTPDAPMATLPEEFLSWAARYRNDSIKNSPKLSCQGLYAEYKDGHGCGWVKRN